MTTTKPRTRTKPRWSAVAVALLLLSLVVGAQTSGPVQYVYDQLGRLIAAIDANGNAAVYNYDAVGNILSIGRYSSTQVSVISFTPGQGPPGSSVTIYGTGFSATASQDTLQFNGVAATITSATANQLVATVPSGATTGPIAVTSPAGSATSSASFTVTSGATPTITGFTPPVGVAGTSVTINGTNFNPVPAYNRVRFNVGSAIVSTAIATSLGATVPASATSGHISVETASGSAVSSSDFFVPFGTHTAEDVAYTGRTTLGSTATVSLSTAPKIGLLLFDGTAGQSLGLQWTTTITSSCTVYVFSPWGSQLIHYPTERLMLEHIIQSRSC